MKQREIIMKKTELAKKKLALCKDIIDKYQRRKKRHKNSIGTEKITTDAADY